MRTPKCYWKTTILISLDIARTVHHATPLYPVHVLTNRKWFYINLTTLLDASGHINHWHVQSQKTIYSIVEENNQTFCDPCHQLQIIYHRSCNLSVCVNISDHAHPKRGKQFTAQQSRKEVSLTQKVWLFSSTIEYMVFWDWTCQWFMWPDASNKVVRFI